MAYTLWAPCAAAWDADDADARARLVATFPARDGVPIPAWRTALLAAQQCAQPARAWAHMAACVRTQRWAPLVAACAVLVDADDARFAAWDAPLRAVQSVRWCAAWLTREQADEETVALAEETAHVGDVVSALAAASAALEARQCGAYAARLAARLVLLARAPPAALGGAEKALQRQARALHAVSSAWDGASCTLGEKCVACGAPVAFTLAPYAQCDAGHVYGRLRALTQNGVWRRGRCWTRPRRWRASGATRRRASRRSARCAARSRAWRRAAAVETGGGLARLLPSLYTTDPASGV